MNTIHKIFNEPDLLKKAIRKIVKTLNIGSHEFRYKINALNRNHYAFLTYEAASLAARLGRKEISIVEFGVGGGGGLKNLEYHAEWVMKKFPVKIRIYGFDTGEGLPGVSDVRDLPYTWAEGQFKMNIHKLSSELRGAKLILGNVSETVKTFFDKERPAPIGGIAFDLDYYSSTRDALSIFRGQPTNFLPRLPLYFDDVLGTMAEMHIDHIGERAAIAEFNDTSRSVKIGPAHYLRTSSRTCYWHHQIYFAHLFEHPNYRDKV